MLRALHNLGWKRVPVVFDNYLSHINIISKWEFFNPYGHRHGAGVLAHLIDHFLTEEENEEENRNERQETEEREREKEEETKRKKKGKKKL